MSTKTCLSNKLFLLSVTLSIAFRLSAQTYDQKIDQAASFVQKKDFTTALPIFKAALSDTAQAGPYDLYYGAIAAIHCNDQTLALQWLQLARKKGLGLAQGDIAAIKGDTTWSPLAGNPQWNDLLKTMEQAYTAKKEKDELNAKAWANDLTNNRIPAAHGTRYQQPKPGFARYFLKYDTLNVPYLVYVPKAYDARQPSTVIVYLHGGVASHETFDAANPDNGKEPIFAIADSLHALVIYPFAKKSFGWQSQPAAFANVLTILNETGRYYHLDPKKTYMVGLSNGGTACFWYATQPTTPFRAFLALSALPKLSIGDLDFSRLRPEAPLYSLNAKDDEVFHFADVEKIYDDEKAVATGWHFLFLSAGTHGFIYGPIGPALLLRYCRMMMMN